MYLLILVGLLCFVPMIVYGTFYGWVRRYRKGPLGLQLLVFLWGCLPATFLAGQFNAIASIPLSQIFVGVGNLTYDSIPSVVAAPIVEEFLKGLAVFAVFKHRQNREFDGPVDGIMFGTLVGLGFTITENFFYFIASPLFIVKFVVIMRTFVFGLNHAFFTSLTGIGFGLASHTDNPIERNLAPLIGYFGAVLAHSLHNLIADLSGNNPMILFLAIVSNWTGVLFIIFVLILVLRRRFYESRHT
jgi:RsiW-degrading membrane proteinase PrsW (M82 family)